ncbi:MAG: sigma-54-dependent transcriptional regulator [Rhodoferax sp.]
MPERILVVEDDATIRMSLGHVLKKQGYDVELAETGREAIELFSRHAFGLVMLDLHLPDVHGLEVLRSLHESDETTIVVVMTAYPEVRTAIDSVRAGAYDYLNKPFELDELRDIVKRALETRRLRLEVERLRACTPQVGPVEGMIGSSRQFNELVSVTRRIAAASRIPVLIRGESGTGKERIAQAIHSLSPRAAGPWITLNCSAVAEGLLESEMFGHERGAFTDAKGTKLGLMELADGGTLFLDEIGDLSPVLQPKLLRAIETQVFRRVGGQKEIKVDVRFVAATNRDLEAMVKQGQFREDLYYRLNVGVIDMPALRERRDDILALATHFLNDAARSMGAANGGLDPAVIGLLMDYRWPGNIRELRNVMERALILAGDAPVRAVHLPREFAAAPDSPRSGGESELLPLAEIEKRHIRKVLAACQGNKTLAAKHLGLARLTLRNKVADYGWSEYIEK